MTDLTYYNVAHTCDAIDNTDIGLPLSGHCLRAFKNITPHYIHERFYSRKSNLHQTYENVIVCTSPAGLTSLVVILAPTPHVDSLHSISPSPASDGLDPLAQTCTRTDVHITSNKHTAKWWSDTGMRPEAITTWSYMQNVCESSQRSRALPVGSAAESTAPKEFYQFWQHEKEKHKLDFYWDIPGWAHMQNSILVPKPVGEEGCLRPQPKICTIGSSAGLQDRCLRKPPSPWSRRSSHALRHKRYCSGADCLSSMQLLIGALWSGHISPVLKQLHWLPVRCRVEYKLAVLVSKSLRGQTLPYLEEEYQLIANEYDPERCHLRSANANVCIVPRTSNRLDDRNFSDTGPRVWNSLPSTLRQPDIDFGQFKQRHFLFVWDIGEPYLCPCLARLPLSVC